MYLYCLPSRLCPPTCPFFCLLRFVCAPALLVASLPLPSCLPPLVRSPAALLSPPPPPGLPSACDGHKAGCKQQARWLPADETPPPILDMPFLSLSSYTPWTQRPHSADASGPQGPAQNSSPSLACCNGKNSNTWAIARTTAGHAGGDRGADHQAQPKSKHRAASGCWQQQRRKAGSGGVDGCGRNAAGRDRRVSCSAGCRPGFAGCRGTG